MKSRDIIIKVEPRYSPSHSNPRVNQYVHTYRVKIKNTGNSPVQLISRHWFIVDGFGKKREVKGMGVIGKQPLILPDQTYEYDSWSPMKTPIGEMYGDYTFVDHADGSLFKAEIPKFSLNADFVGN